jgi:hypothetical protein
MIFFLKKYWEKYFSISFLLQSSLLSKHVNLGTEFKTVTTEYFFPRKLGKFSLIYL